MGKHIMLDVLIREEPEGGYSVVCTPLDVASQGESIDEALANIKEAVELYLESAEELGIKDEVLEKLGLREEDFDTKELIVPRILRTEMPITIGS